MDIRLGFFEDRVEGENTLFLAAREPLEELRLDARDLEIHAVEWVPVSTGGAAGPVRAKPGPAGTGAEPSPNPRPLAFEVRAREAALVIRLPRQVAAGERFAVRAAATCRPSDTILEGIYRDTTPPGCPRQYMSQCEQWGFQRILPVIDDCTAKCTMRATLEGDARYTHLISNGDVCRATNPDGRPVPVPGAPGRKRITYVNDIPMAPYLFIACAGTWDAVTDEVVYPSGRRVRLAYLVPPGRAAGAALPMRILKDAVLWQGRTQDYEYAREVYRTICMERSNWGGMENVGNTTIVTSAALVDEYTNDRRLEYAHAVIVHEFEHNQCGSDVTMETPFDMWLNEAFTVDVERQFMAGRFDPDRVRLSEVDAMRAPVHGPLAVEDAGHLGNIVRDGFNSPDELVDGVTYVKAAEVIRMLRLILGASVFRRGKNLYFERYDGGNANTDQFFACFEEVSGRDLAQFKREWLYTIGYPRIEATHSYDPDARTLVVDLRQTRAGEGGLFHVPVEIAAVDDGGRDIPGAARVVELVDGGAHGESAARARVAFHDVPRPAFLSLNRNCSFYGTFTDKTVTGEELVKQIHLDPSLFGRVEAMRALTDLERVRLIHDPRTPVGEAWLRTMGDVIRDRGLPPGLKAYLLSIEESSLDRRYLPFFRERYAARSRLLRATAEAHGDDLASVFHATDTYRRLEEPSEGIEERRLKAVLLRILVETDAPAAWDLCERHFAKAWNITDRLSALLCMNLTGAPSRESMLEEAYAAWHGHLAAYGGYLSVIAARTREDVFDLIAREEARPAFDLRHPEHSRSLYLPMAANNAMLWTDRGIAWAADTVARLAPVNENIANRLLACFQHARQLADDLRPKVFAALERLKASVKEQDAPSVAGRINAILRDLEA